MQRNSRSLLSSFPSLLLSFSIVPHTIFPLVSQYSASFFIPYTPPISSHCPPDPVTPAIYADSRSSDSRSASGFSSDHCDTLTLCSLRHALECGSTACSPGLDFFMIAGTLRYPRVLPRVPAVNSDAIRRSKGAISHRHAGLWGSKTGSVKLAEHDKLDTDNQPARSQ